MKILKIIIIILINLHIACGLLSCSAISDFRKDRNGRIFRRISLSHVPLKPNLTLMVKIYTEGDQSYLQKGELTLENDQRKLYDDLLNERNITFRLGISVTNPPPIISGVFLNGNQICSSPIISSYDKRYGYQSTTSIIKWGIQIVPYFSQNRPTHSNLPTYQLPQTSNPSIGNTSGNQLALSVCGVRRDESGSSSLIIDARKHDFPWLAAFYYNKNGFICGGTLVSTKIIVTAAHCIIEKSEIQRKEAKHSRFYLGKYNLNNFDETEVDIKEVQEFIIHPSWNSLNAEYTGDLALALVLTSIDFNNNVIPLCLPPQRNNHDDIVHKSGLIAGWGVTKSGGSSEVPNSVDLPVVSDTECLKSHPRFTQIKSKTSFCVGDGSGKSPCNGDSGGAFAIKNDADNRYYFRGIVSAGLIDQNHRCDDTKYTVFTDVAQYSDWINSYINKYG